MPITMTEERITPALAAAYLATQRINREVRAAHVRLLAEEMMSGNFVLTHQGIAFDERGAMIDGQHRLEAVLASNVTVPMLVFRGVPTRAALVCDSHYARRLGDLVRILTGAETHRLACSTANVLRASIRQGGRINAHRSTARAAMDFYLRHAEAISFAVSALTPEVTRISVAGVGAVLARAWYSQDREKVARFARILMSGMPDSQSDCTVIALRNRLLATRSGGFHWVDSVYRRTEYVCASFLGGLQPKYIRCADTELFPIAEDSWTS